MAIHVRGSAKKGESNIRVRVIVLLAAVLVAGCSRHVSVSPPPKATIYYCKTGTNELVRVPFSADPKLTHAGLAAYAVNQVLAGPPENADLVALFPQGTRASVSLSGDTATVDLTGSIERSFQSGGSDETGMFKSLTYTLTALPGIDKVQVLLGGRTVASLPGGAFELDEPLTRAMFAQ
ncbi:MAG TPA: GerMN domain-containing protein [Candidatus Acidoferrales bacterium]|nr:GerMN domain-containing protein [Candidatus Acidoferrales bacterium]